MKIVVCLFVAVGMSALIPAQTVRLAGPASAWSPTGANTAIVTAHPCACGVGACECQDISVPVSFNPSGGGVSISPNVPGCTPLPRTKVTESTRLTTPGGAQRSSGVSVNPGSVGGSGNFTGTSNGAAVAAGMIAAAGTGGTASVTTTISYTFEIPNGDNCVCVYTVIITVTHDPVTGVPTGASAQG